MQTLVEGAVLARLFQYQSQTSTAARVHIPSQTPGPLLPVLPECQSCSLLPLPADAYAAQAASAPWPQPSRQLCTSHALFSHRRQLPQVRTKSCCVDPECCWFPYGGCCKCRMTHQADARVATSAQSTCELAANLDPPASRQRAGCQSLQRHNMHLHAHMSDQGHLLCGAVSFAQGSYTSVMSKRAYAKRVALNRGLQKHCQDDCECLGSPEHLCSSHTSPRQSAGWPTCG